MLIRIKPLSVNDAWRGRRFKTDAYKHYERELLFKLRPCDVPTGKLRLSIIVGYATNASDADNCLKPIQDILQKKYDFNDNRVKKLEVEACAVGKGNEFIHIEFDKYQISPKLNQIIVNLGLKIK